MSLENYVLQMKSMSSLDFSIFVYKLMIRKMVQYAKEP